MWEAKNEMYIPVQIDRDVIFGNINFKLSDNTQQTHTYFCSRENKTDVENFISTCRTPGKCGNFHFSKA